MLVTFRTKAHANITMFGDVAVTLLKLAGHSGTVPSAILAQDIPAALVKLEGGLPLVSMQAQAATNDEPDTDPKVPLRRRAMPLLALLRAANAAGADVLIDTAG
jgi:uncharacterized protein DUF1840